MTTVVSFRNCAHGQRCVFPLTKKINNDTQKTKAKSIIEYIAEEKNSLEFQAKVPDTSGICVQ